MSRIFAWKDRSSWPMDWPQLDCEPDDSRLTELGEDLRQRYEFIRCFHGARPIDVQSYYRNGLCLSELATMVRHAKSVFGGPSFPPVSEAEIDHAIDALGYSDHGKLFVALDDRHLVECAGHYLIYGSEYIMAIAAHLPDDRAIACQQCLKTIGTPTVYEIEFPMSHVSKGDLIQLAWYMGKMELIDDVPCTIDFTFTLREPLPSECIVGHHHPQRISDWHNGGATYVWQSE